MLSCIQCICICFSIFMFTDITGICCFCSVCNGTFWFDARSIATIHREDSIMYIDNITCIDILNVTTVESAKTKPRVNPKTCQAKLS